MTNDNIYAAQVPLPISQNPEKSFSHPKPLLKEKLVWFWLPIKISTEYLNLIINAISSRRIHFTWSLKLVLFLPTFYTCQWILLRIDESSYHEISHGTEFLLGIPFSLFWGHVIHLLPVSRLLFPCWVWVFKSENHAYGAADGDWEHSGSVKWVQSNPGVCTVYDDWQGYHLHSVFEKFQSFVMTSVKRGKTSTFLWNQLRSLFT